MMFNPFVFPQVLNVSDLSTQYSQYSVFDHHHVSSQFSYPFLGFQTISYLPLPPLFLPQAVSLSASSTTFSSNFLSLLSAILDLWYYAISDFWLTSSSHPLSRQCKAIRELFEIYGFVVRVGPQQGGFRDASTSRCMHKFDRRTFYKGLLTYVASMFYISPN